MKWAVIQFHEYDVEMDEYDDYEEAKKIFAEMSILGSTTVYLVEVKDKRSRS